MTAARILTVSPVFPAPLNTGTRIRIANLLRAFHALGHELGLVSFITPDEEPYVDEIAPLLKDMRLVPIGRSVSLSRKLRRLAEAIPKLLQGVPRFAAFAKHPEIRLAIEELAPAYDHVLIELYFMGFNVSDRLLATSAREKFALVEHDVSYIPLERKAAVTRGLAKLSAIMACRAGKSAECAMVRRFPTVIAMSGTDADLLQTIAPKSRIIVAPNGVDCRKTARTGRILLEQSAPRFLFAGNMEHYPNLDAIRYFVREIFPRVRRELPSATLTVAGFTGGVLLDDMNAPGVEFTGFVPDLSPLYAAATAVICPYRIGGGTRLKILESLAVGVPLVSTSIGAEGISLTHGKNVLFADNPDDFFTAVGGQGVVPVVAAQLAANGRELAERLYDWPCIAAELSAALS